MTLIEYNESDIGYIGIRETQQRKTSLRRHHFDGIQLWTRKQGREIAVLRDTKIAETRRKTRAKIVTKLVNQGKRRNEKNDLLPTR